MDFEISRHAIKRIRERLGINKSGAEREVGRALAGMTISDCTGRLRKFLDSQRHLHGDAAHFRVTPAAVFAFKGNTLTTVLPMPKAHARSARSQWDRFKGKREASQK